MNRLHLVELEDLRWCPAFLRNALTELLTFFTYFARNAYRLFARRLAVAMREINERRIVELGAGGGGTGRVMVDLLEAEGLDGVRVTLTDLYPNRERFRAAVENGGGKVSAAEAPVDATAVPPEIDGFRLFCNVFHHLPPPVAFRCLEDAVKKNKGIAVVELIERSPRGFLHVFLALFVVLFATPIVKPFRLSRLFFTYLVPLIPFVVLWDGCVSCLRIYSPRELEALVAALGECGYAWDIGRIPVPGKPVWVTYLIGVPLQKSAVE